MAMHFTTVADAARVQGVKVLVYSGAGIGKTVLSSTLGDNSVLISAESGILSLRKQNLERIFGVASRGINYNLPIIQVQTISDFNDALSWCQTSAEARAFQNIGLDSLTEIAEAVLNSSKRTCKDPRQAYGELTEKMETMVRAFRDLPGKNVYMAAKQEPMKDELTGIVKYGPSMPGRKLGPGLPYFFDEVFRLGVATDPQGKSFRFLQTQPDIQYDAKDRSGALASQEFPHLGYVFAKIQGA